MSFRPRVMRYTVDFRVFVSVKSVPLSFSIRRPPSIVRRITNAKFDPRESSSNRETFFQQREMGKKRKATSKIELEKEQAVDEVLCGEKEVCFSLCTLANFSLDKRHLPREVCKPGKFTPR